MKKPIVIVFKESLAQSLASDLATFGFLLLCIWASQGSRWWTFFTGALFLLFIVARIPINSSLSRKVYSTADLRKLADEIDRDAA